MVRAEHLDGSDGRVDEQKRKVQQDDYRHPMEPRRHVEKVVAGKGLGDGLATEAKGQNAVENGEKQKGFSGL